MMILSEIAQVLGGQLQGQDLRIAGVESDSRRVQAGQLFVALNGQNVDGHGFIPEVADKGVFAALVTRYVDSPLPQIKVADTRIALGQLAAYWRQKLGVTLYAVTGSNGKTTTKEMLASMMRAHFKSEEAVLATEGNFNNDIGMPLTLLKLKPSHQAAVIEIGMNHMGEIAYLTDIAKPDVALINNAGTAHIGELGSRENIAQAKGEIFSGLPQNGVAVINADDHFAGYWQGLNCNRKIVTFGMKTGADVQGRALSDAGLVELSAQGEAVTVQMPLMGEHNVYNALAATAVARQAGVSLTCIKTALEGFGGVKGRLQIKQATHGALLIDDTYNANPDSMKAAIDVLKQYRKNTWFVMGDMGELGDGAAQMHADIGSYAKTQQIQHLCTLGKASAYASQSYGGVATHYEDIEALVADLKKSTAEDDVILVKGSRFMRMERVVDALTSREIC